MPIPARRRRRYAHRKPAPIPVRMSRAGASMTPPPPSAGGIAALIGGIVILATLNHLQCVEDEKMRRKEADRRGWDPNTTKFKGNPSPEAFLRLFPPAATRIASNRILFPKSPETPHSPLRTKWANHESTGATSALSGEPSPAGNETYRALRGACPERLTVTVTDTEQVNDDTKKITFAIPLESTLAPARPILGVPAGLQIHLASLPAEPWTPVGAYTPISDVDMPDRFQVLVKKYPDCRISTYLHSVQPADRLLATTPIGLHANYKDYLPSDTPRDLLFIAAGTGITPMYSLTKRILGMPSDQTRVQLLWGVRGVRDLVLKEELDDLQRKHPNRLQVTYFISGQASPQETLVLDDPQRFQQGRITKEKIQEALGRCQSGTLGDGSTKVWVCGPPDMVTALAGRRGALSNARLHRREPILRALGIVEEKTILSELGITARQVHRFDGKQWGPAPYQSAFFKYLSGAIKWVFALQGGHVETPLSANDV